MACNVGNPLKTNGEVNFLIKFDSKQLDDSETQLNFIIFANSTSKEEEPQNPLHLRADVVKIAEVSLKG